MQSLLKQEKLDFILQNYSEQIEALNSFIKETNAKNIPLSHIKFGGGTALAIYYFQHRLSFDIDLFVSDVQYLDFLRPKQWIEESTNFQASEYIDQFNHIGLVSNNAIKVDILIDGNSDSKKIDDSRLLFNFDLGIESIEDIIAKKITFRKQDNKTRDIIDIAVCLHNDERLFVKLLESDKICLEDLQILRNALKNLNLERYYSQLEIVKPVDAYINISKHAPSYIIEMIEKL